MWVAPLKELSCDALHKLCKLAGVADKDVRSRNASVEVSNDRMLIFKHVCNLQKYNHELTFVNLIFFIPICILMIGLLQAKTRGTLFE
jgi:hypothetical protein